METPRYIRHTLFTLRRVSDGASFFVGICIVLGILTGLAAFVLKKLMGLTSRAVTDGLSADMLSWHLLIFPLVGIILAGCFQKYILRQNLDHGTDRINHALRSRNLKFPLSLTVSPIVGSAMTLGFGGSAGAEGPIAYAGAAIGSRIGRFVRLSEVHMNMMIAIGAGAGIAGIFQAPFGGLFFAIEILSVDLSALAVVGLAAGSLTAATTSYLLRGDMGDIVFSHIPQFEPVMLLWAIPIGILCGMYSYYYSSVMTRMTSLLEGIRHDWPKWLISGALLSISVFLLPSLFGEGYGAIAEILDGRGDKALMFGSVFGLFKDLPHVSGSIMLAATIVLVKVFSSAFTNSGGGVAGDFAPTIFAGAIFGYLLAVLAKEVCGFGVSAAAVVFMSMGGVMSGCVGAPLMAMFIVSEMSGGYELLIPMAVSAVVSYLVVRGIRTLANRSTAA